MPTVAEAWDSWLKALESHGFNPRAMLRPATSELDLPTGLAALYRLADGQDSPWRTDIPGATDLFPCSQFLSVAEAKDLREEWRGFGVPFTLDAGGSSLAVDDAGRVVALGDGEPRVVAAGLAEYLVALAEYPLEITDFDGEFTWDAPRLR